MGEAGGATSFADVAGGANAEVLSGVTLGEPGGLIGDSATSALFSGSGAARASVNLSGTHKLTIEFWMKWSTYGADDHLALEFTPNFNEYNGGFLVDPDATPGSDVAASLGRGSSVNTVFFKRPPAGEWHYYAFVFNTEAPAEEEITPYVDGHAVSFTKSESGTGAGNFANSTLFWMSRDASTLFGAGSMQDLALYDTTLSSSTILHHYELGAYGPKASFTSTPLAVTAGVPVHLDASGSSSTAGPITDYAWDFNGSKTYSTNTGSTTVASEATAVVAFGPPVGQTPVVDYESFYVGETLTAGNVAALGAGPISESYQWERCNSSGESCVEISGATSSTYVSSSGDIGSEIRVTVAYTNTHGTDTRTSSPTWWTVQNHAPFNVSSPYMTASDIGFGAGDTITVHPGTWLGSHPISYAYQWESCVSGSCEAISGATASTYTVPTGGKNIRVKVKATNAAGSATEYARSQYVYPENSAPGSVVAPTISGVAKDGETLTAHHEEWHGEPTSYSYQWLSCKVGYTKCNEIAGATGATIEPTAELDGLQLTVEVTATNAYGSTTVRAEERTTAVVAIPPVNTTLPEVTGEAVVGNQLQSTAGSWFGNTGILTPLSGPAYTDQWQLCNASGEACVDIPEASSFGYESAYTPPAADAGSTVRVLVSTRSPDESAEASAASPATAVLAAATLPSNTATPTISGTAQDGLVLTATSGTWSGSPVIHYTYQWKRCNSSGGECVEIKEATGATYTAARNDIGHKLRVVVSAANAAGSVSSTSEPTGVVAEPAAPTNVEAPRFPLFLESWGEPEFPVYQPIHPTPGTWTGDPTVTYEWQRCDPTCTAIPSATSLLYTPRAADVGSKLNLVETATNVTGSATSETGLSTDAVKVTGMSYSGTFYPSEKYTGATAVGQTIAAGGIFSSSPELPITTSYEFLLVNEPEAPNAMLASGSSPKYTLTSEDLGHEIEIVLTGTAWRADKAVAVESDTIDVYTHVVEVPPTNDTAPTITGESTAGSPLTAHLGTWHGGGGTLSYSYQWQTCNSSGEACTNISGATSSTYTTSSSDDGDTLRVRITAANQGASTTATSAASGTITAASTPANTSLPSISGEAKDLQTLTASHGTWSGSTPLTYAYQWLSCSAEGSECYEMPGATGATYQVEEGDVGNTLKVQVTATNAAGSSTATSSATATVAAVAAPVNLTLPSITLLGTAAPGAQITTDGGSWQNIASTPPRGALTYQWQRCGVGGGGCEDIAEGLQQTYNLASEDGGHYLRVVVTAQNESGRVSSTSQLSPIIGETTPSSSEKILFTTANAIFTASVEGGESHELTNCETVDSEAGASASACHFHHPNISPTGEMIATEVLPSGSSSHSCVEEQLCPSAPSGGPEDVNVGGKIALMNYDGSQARFLPGNGSQPTWSPDGTTITYTRIIESEGTTTTHLYSANADGSNATDPTPVETGTKYSEAPAYSPDGSQLAYIGRESTAEPWGLYVANADGTEAKRLDIGELTETDMPQFSSDSNAIIFLGIPPYGKPTTGYEELEGALNPTVRVVYQINTDGSGLTQINYAEHDDMSSPILISDTLVTLSTEGVAEGEAGPGIAYIWHPPRIEIVPTEGSGEAIVLPPPPGEERITDVTRGVLGPVHPAKPNVCDPPSGWGEVPSWCTSYRQNPDDELEQDVQLYPVASESSSSSLNVELMEIHVDGPLSAPSNQRWATVRDTPGTYVIGNAESGWLLNTRTRSNSATSRGYHVTSYYGNFQQTAVSPDGMPFTDPEGQCGWLLGQRVNKPTLTGLDEPSCPKDDRPSITRYSVSTNCPQGSTCVHGTNVYLTKSAAECANLKFNDSGDPTGCTDTLNTIPAGTCVEWRYITKPALNGSGQWVMIKDRARYDWNGSWLFIPRSSLGETLPNYDAPGRGTCNVTAHYPARD